MKPLTSRLEFWIALAVFVITPLFFMPAFEMKLGFIFGVFALVTVLMVSGKRA